MTDTQVVELLGRQRLIGELLTDELEVAIPMRDRGVDLIVYADLSRQVTRFVSRPIQMRASTAAAFGVNQKYGCIADLILAHVWRLADPSRATTFGLRYSEAVRVADEMGWTRTRSWIDGRAYGTSRPSSRFLELLEPNRMTRGRW